jgi:hypothetical protein
MKRIILFAALCTSSALFSQTTRVSVSDGDFLNPFVWNPIGIPASGDQLTINHDLIMTTGIYYTAGSITIASGGSLVEDATDRDFWVDGTGSLINHGLFRAHLFLASPNTTVNNFGTFASIDSVWSQTSLINIGSIEAYDFLNDETATLTNEGTLIIGNDMNNQGLIDNKQWASIDLTNDFSNCNLQTLDGRVENDGIFCVGNNFSNCFGDTLRGSGHYYIGNAASNLGVLEGNATFHTPSGNFAITGTVGSSVTITTGVCNLGITESKGSSIQVFPNPASDLISIEGTGEFRILTLNGTSVIAGFTETGSIDISKLTSGMYLIQVGETITRFAKL